MNNNTKSDHCFNEIPVGWELVRLGDAVEINRESRDPARQNPDGKFIYIDIESVEGESGIIRSTKEIFGKEAPSRARRVIHQNDIIMSTVRPYLKAFALVPREYNNQICSTGFAVLSCKNEIIPHYLLYALFSKNVIEQCNKMMMGGQYPALNQSQVAKIKIPLPPLPEQRRIAEVLGTVDSAIQKVGGAIEGTERLKKGLMQRLLTKGIGHERFKETEVGRVPEEWGVVRLGEKCEFLDSKRVPIKEQDRTKRRGIYPYYGAQGIIDWIDDYIFDGEFILLAEDGENLHSKKLPLAYKVSGKFWVNNHAHVLKVKKNEISNDFLIYLLNFIEIRSYIVGSAQPKLNQSDAIKIKLPTPPLPEQRRIAEILGAVDRKMELERRRKEKLERVKKGLMNELLTGRKMVKVKVA